MTLQAMPNDISQGFFSTLGLTNRNMQNATLVFNIEAKKIDRIVIATSPPVEFLTEIKSKEIPSNNIIFYLGDADQFSNYKRTGNIISKLTSLKTEIQSLTDLEDKNKTIFFALELPLQTDNLEKIISVLKEIPTKSEA